MKEDIREETEIKLELTKKWTRYKFKKKTIRIERLAKECTTEMH